MGKNLMISCREATELAIKNNLGGMSFFNRMRLRFHMLMCSFCRLFEKQNKMIDDALDHLDEKAPTHMSIESKKKVIDKVIH